MLFSRKTTCHACNESVPIPDDARSGMHVTCSGCGEPVAVPPSFGLVQRFGMWLRGVSPTAIQKTHRKLARAGYAVEAKELEVLMLAGPGKLDELESVLAASEDDPCSPSFDDLSYIVLAELADEYVEHPVFEDYCSY